MRNFTYTGDLAPEVFDAFSLAHPAGSMMQSSKWAAIKNNWKAIYTGVYEDEVLKAAGLVLKRELPLGFCFLYLPKGPVMDFSDQELLDFYFKNLQKEGRRQRALLIKMDPNIVLNHFEMENPVSVSQEDLESSVLPFKTAGGRYQGATLEISETIQPRFHMIIDLQPDFESGLPKKTKKNIKEAIKRQVKIVEGHQELLDDFSMLMEKTEQRKNISLRSKEYFRRLLDTYGDQAVIMLAVLEPAKDYRRLQESLAEIESELEKTAENQKKRRFTLEEKKASVLKDLERLEENFAGEFPERLPIAGVLSVISHGQAEMLYAGMDEQYRRYMPQYLQYVENIKWAMDRGCSTFSMGGIEGDLKDGLSQFKNHFNPEVVEYLGEFDLPTWRLLYPIAHKLYERVKQA